MSKYELLPEQLIYEGTLDHSNFFEPGPLDESKILDTHDEAYWTKLKTLSLNKREIRKTGFPLSKQLIIREKAIASGTLQATNFALEFGCAMNIAGGTHHAFSNRGEGFCLLNDQAIAANWLIKENGFNKVLIVDLDVHQGNGTAEIFNKEKRIFTFSMHGANNYPLVKEHSDWDIPLSDKTDDGIYLNLLEKALQQLIDSYQPDFIFYQSGVDVLETDTIGRLGLTKDGCKKRDELVFSSANDNKIPIVASMGGGYSSDLNDIVEAHANTYRVAQEIFF